MYLLFDWLGVSCFVTYNLSTDLVVWLNPIQPNERSTKQWFESEYYLPIQNERLIHFKAVALEGKSLTFAFKQAGPFDNTFFGKHSSLTDDKMYKSKLSSWSPMSAYLPT